MALQIRVLTIDECKLVTECRICEAPLKKDHWRELYCSRKCRNAAYRGRIATSGTVATLTPELEKLLDELRYKSSREAQDNEG